MRALAVALAVTALTFGAYADDLPDPSGCSGFAENKTGEDAACDAAIAAEKAPAVKSVLLYRRAHEIIDRNDFNTYPKAIELLSEAIRLLPANYRALHERAYLYNEYGRWADALEDIDARIKLDPQEYHGYQERGMARFNLGDLEGFYEDRQTVVMLNSRAVFARISLADAATWLGRFDEALKELDKAASLGPTDKQTSEIERWRRDIATMTNASKAGAKACIDTNVAREGEKQTFVGDCTLAFLAAKTPTEKAEALTLRSIGWLADGREYASRGDSIVAAGLLPDSPDMHTNLAFSYMRDHHSTGAIWEFDKSIALKPTYAAYAGRAQAKLNLRDLEGAFTDAKASLDIEPNTVALIVMGDLFYEKYKSYDNAKTFWIAAWHMGSRGDDLDQRLKDAGVSIPPPDDPPKK